MTSQEDIDFDRAYVEKHGLYGLLKLAWPILCPRETFSDGRHLFEVCLHVCAWLAGVIPRLLITVPPGSSKSLIVSVILPAYVWGCLKEPHRKFMYGTYITKMATRDANRTRDLIRSQWFQDRWPVELDGVAQATFYTTHAGGWRYSDGVASGNFTGRHPDYLVIDDPINAIKTLGNAAELKTDLNKVIEVWDGALSSRGADPNQRRQLVIMQRLHDTDLVGYLLDRAKQEGGVSYELLRLPMYYEADAPCVTRRLNGTVFGGDWRTFEGERLCETRWNEETLGAIRFAQGNAWSAQYQQRPASKQGQIFKRTWFRFWDPDVLVRRGANPYTGDGFDNLICSWDFTFKNSMGSDYVCGQVWAKLDADYYMLERVYKRMNFPNSLTAIEAMIRRWPTMGAKVVEDKANGPAIIASLERKVAGLVAWPNSRGKIANANAVSYLHRAGNVWYPPEFEHATGDEAHVECMAKFPLAKHDDSVDAETQALAYLEENRNALFEALAAQQRAQARR